MFAIISVLIKLDSRGPVFFKQIRVGQGAKEFKLIKFRTMRVDSEKGGFLTVGNSDSRITNIGRVLRNYKLDELPQLINVFAGQMSFVGPRPEVPRFVRLYTSEQMEVLSVKPGITDPASLKYRNENELLEAKKDPTQYYIDHLMPEKLEINLDYIRKRTFLSDLRIIINSFVLMFKGSHG